MSLHRRASLALFSLALLASTGLLEAVPYRFLPFDQPMANRQFALKRGNDVVELKNLHHLKRSDAVNVPGEAPPMLIALDRKDPEGKPVGIEVKLPAGVTSPLVLILPDPRHPTGVKPFVIEDDASRFKWGTIRMLNATGKPVMTKVDTKVTELPPSWTPVEIDPGGAMRNMGIQAAYKTNPAKILYSSVWEHDPDVRELVIVIPGLDARLGEMEFKVIPENRKVVEAEAAEAKKDQ